MNGLRTIRVATFYDDDRPGAPTRSRVRTYTRDYNEEWDGCIVYTCIAASPKEARRQAVEKRFNRESLRWGRTSQNARTADVKWRFREPMNKDPWWEGEFRGIRIHISVASEWIWEWELDDGQNADVARGSVYVEHPDKDEWNYQGADAAKAVAVAVAKLFAAGKASA